MQSHVNKEIHQSPFHAIHHHSILQLFRFGNLFIENGKERVDPT